MALTPLQLRTGMVRKTPAAPSGVQIAKVAPLSTPTQGVQAAPQAATAAPAAPPSNVNPVAKAQVAPGAPGAPSIPAYVAKVVGYPVAAKAPDVPLTAPSTSWTPDARAGVLQRGAISGLPGAPVNQPDPYKPIDDRISKAKEEAAAAAATQQTEITDAAAKAREQQAADQAAAAEALSGLSAQNKEELGAAGNAFTQQLSDLIEAAKSGLSGMIGTYESKLDAKQKAAQDQVASLYDDMLSTNDQMREQMLAQGQLQLGNFLRRNSALAAMSGQGLGSGFLSGQRQALTSGMNALQNAHLQAMQQRMGVMGQRAGAVGGLASQGLNLAGNLYGQGMGQEGQMIGTGLGMQGSGAGTVYGANADAINRGYGAQANLVGQGFGYQNALNNADLSAILGAISQGVGQQNALTNAGLNAWFDERGALRDAEATAAANEAETNQKQVDAQALDLLKSWFGPTATFENLQGKKRENLTEAQQAILDMILEYQKTGDPETLKKIRSMGVEPDGTDSRDSNKDGTVSAWEAIASL